MHEGKGENRMAAGGKGALEYQLIYLCVDAAGPYGEFSGRLVSPYLTEQERFQTVGELMWKVDRLLSRCGMAKRYEERRYFPSAGSPVQIKRDETLTPRSVRLPSGGCGTFAVRILFRRNATWQGEVRWLERNERELFRSARELIEMVGGAAAAESFPCAAVN